MALGDLFTNLHLLFRWLHVIAGITWIGHLYFFNFVNLHFQGDLDDATKKLVNPKLMPRALFWFRWGAMVTFVAGWILFTQNYMYTPGQGFGPSSLFMTPDGAMTGRAIWILMGMAFGTMMWFNVWFVIWPAQKAMLSGKVPADQVPAVRKKALTASRMNVYMSGPMLFGMIAPQNYGAVNAVTMIVAIVLGFFVVWTAFNAAAKVGKSV